MVVHNGRVEMILEEGKEDNFVEILVSDAPMFEYPINVKDLRRSQLKIQEEELAKNEETDDTATE